MSTLHAVLSLWPALAIGLFVAAGAWVGEWLIARIDAHYTRRAMYRAMRTADADLIESDIAGLWVSDTGADAHHATHGSLR